MDMAPSIEAREIYFDIKTVSTKTGIPIRRSLKSSANSTPAETATPFPPLKFKYGENVWPKMALDPVNMGIKEFWAMIPPFVKYCIINTGIKPLKASRRVIIKNHFLPRTLAALVAPAFLLPTVLTSIFLIFLQKI